MSEPKPAELVEPEWLLRLRRWRPRLLLGGRLAIFILPLCLIATLAASPPRWVTVSIAGLWAAAALVTGAATVLGLVDPRSRKRTAISLVVRLAIACLLVVLAVWLVSALFHLLIEILDGLGHIH